MRIGLNHSAARRCVINEVTPVRWDVATQSEPPLGAHLITPRQGYRHHGIYVGQGKVVHYAGLSATLRRGSVEEVAIERFAIGYDVWIRPSPAAKYCGEQAVRRARSRLGEDCYRLLTNNCEHFCVWCLYDESRSEQVEGCLAHPGAAWRTAMAMFKGVLASRGRMAEPAANAG